MSAPSPTIPEGLDLMHEGDGIVIRKTWLTWKVAPLAIFAVFWDGFIVFFYYQILSKPHPLVAVLFPLIHAAVGAGLTYYVVASLVNKTDIQISSTGVRVATGPVPWFGNKEVGIDEITDIVVRERTGNRGARTFAVMYADRSRRERSLAPAYSQSDQARFVAQTVRDTLGLASPAN